jgi:hypothetical protein
VTDPAPHLVREPDVASAPLLARLWIAVDGRRLPRADWLRDGWPRSVLVLLVALPLIVAGPVRFITGVPLPWGFAIATLLSFIVLYTFAPACRRSLPRGRAIAANFVLVSVALFAAELPYNRHFHGLANYVDPAGFMSVDGGYHIQNYWEFVRRSSDVYVGFVALYSFWDALRHLGSRHLLIALNASFIFGRVVTATAPCVVAFAVLQRLARRRSGWVAGTVACLASSIAVQYIIVLPEESFQLMGGFWPHLFGLVVVMALWLADVLVRPRLLRLLALLGCVVLYRYTYGLNLADVCAAVSAVLACEALGRDAAAWWARTLALAGAIAAALTARFCYHLTTPLFAEYGWIVDHDVMGAWRGQIFVLGAFALAMVPAPGGALRGTGIVRALRIPFFFGVGNALFVFMIHRLPPAAIYYFDKYDFHATTLVASAVVVLATVAAVLVVERRDAATLIRAVALVALVTLGLGRVRSAFASYQEGFREQVFGGEFKRSHPWVLPAAVARMQQVLNQRGKTFGGYVGKYYAMHIFTNALFDHGDRDWFHDPIVSQKPGQCFFWDPDGRYPALDSTPDQECYRFVQQPWGQYPVCGACF